MSVIRAAVVVGFTALMGSRLTTCRSPGEGGSEPNPAKAEAVNVTLPGVDTEALTTREKSEWSRLVSEILAPCPDQPVSIAQCVKESRPCRTCVFAARFLVDQARRGRVRAQVETAYKARFSKDAVRALDLNGSPGKGPENAKVVIAEWADFECPFCGAARTVLDDLHKKYPNDTRIVFKHFPLGMHQHAEKAARGAVAAWRQNKFWEMHGALFESQQKLDPESVERLAKDLGLDIKRFVQDRDSEAVADLVTRDRKQGDALELKSTPSIFINGRPFPIGSDFSDELEEWVKLEIQLTQDSPQAPTPAASASTPPLPQKASAKPGSSGGS